MYAVRIIGPSGFVQYLRIEQDGKINLVQRLARATRFNNGFAAQMNEVRVPPNEAHGCIVEVINLDDES